MMSPELLAGLMIVFAILVIIIRFLEKLKGVPPYQGM